MSRTMVFNTVRPSVQAFAQDMERVLRLNDHKGGWEDMEYLEIHRRIENELCELNLAIALLMQDGPSPERLEAIIHEACDIANFAMFAAAKAHRAFALEAEHFPGCTFPKGDHTEACRADFEQQNALFDNEVKP